MNFSLLDATAVIVARQFNPSVLTETWLSNAGVLEPGDLGEDYAFTPAIVQVTAKRYAFLMLPERFQFSPRVPREEQKSLLLDKVGRIIREIPHTPYAAVGLNFTYRIVPENVDVKDLTRKIFFVPGSPLHEEFDAPDARFGGYLSRDVIGCRMKLDVKPALGVLPGSDSQQHFVLMEFNFHHDIAPGDGAADATVAALAHWDEAMDKADRIVRSVAAEDKR